MLSSTQATGIAARDCSGSISASAEPSRERFWYSLRRPIGIRLKRNDIAPEENQFAHRLRCTPGGVPVRCGGTSIRQANISAVRVCLCLRMDRAIHPEQAREFSGQFCGRFLPTSASLRGTRGETPLRATSARCLSSNPGPASLSLQRLCSSLPSAASGCFQTSAVLLRVYSSRRYAFSSSSPTRLRSVSIETGWPLPSFALSSAFISR